MNHDGTTTQRRKVHARAARDNWRRVVVSLWFLLLLAACAEAPPPRLITQIQVEKPEIPDELLACPAIPLPPEGIAMQSDVAAYIIDLFGAGSECRRKLEAVGGLVNGAPDLIRGREP